MSIDIIQEIRILILGTYKPGIRRMTYYPSDIVRPGKYTVLEVFIERPESLAVPIK